jgi:hypothetical protein
MNDVTIIENRTLVPSYDLSQALPNLHEGREIPVDLSSSYWTPEKEGEQKKGFYQRIEESTYTNEGTGEQVSLPCIILIAQDASGNVTTIRNGSKRLVATIEEAVNDGRITEGMPLCITYLGKEKNKTNSFKSDRWSVKPIIIG